MKPVLNNIDSEEIARKVAVGLIDHVKTEELSSYLEETAIYMSQYYIDYETLASRIYVSNLHKQTCDSFLDTMELEVNNFNQNTNTHTPLISNDVMKICRENSERIQRSIDYDRDYLFDYFGLKTLERNYLIKLNGKTIERPQDKLMKVSLGIHKEDLEAAIETYEYMSTKQFIHATPTLFNSATVKPQMSSCFLLKMKEDSIEGIFDTLKRCAIISKCGGGIGLTVNCIRSTGSYISGTDGRSNGIVPMLRVFNNASRYVDQGKCFFLKKN